MQMLKGEKGASIVIVALVLVALCGFVALTIDVGRLYIARQHVQNAVDAAALAGGLDLSSQAKATQKAIECANANSITDVTVTFPPDGLRVDGWEPVDYTFARVLGFTTKNVSAYAIVRKLAPVSTVYGDIMPWGIQDADYVLGQEVTLKLDTASLQNPNLEPTPGNFYALALGGTGGANYVDNIKWGYQGTLNVGDVIETETGELVGPTNQGVAYDPNTHDSLFEQASVPPWADDTWNNYDYGNPRIAIVPIISAIGHGHTEVTILGFAAFYILNTNGKFVTGTFLEYAITNAVSSGTGKYYGLSVLYLAE